MIAGIGIDIVEIDRMKKASAKWGKGFLEKVFTRREMAYSFSKPLPHQHLAARFAAKEAVIKAFGEPRKYPLKWNEIEVRNDDEGRPVIEFHRDALAVKRKKRIDGVILSISHSKQYAVANVILMRKGR